MLAFDGEKTEHVEFTVLPPQTLNPKPRFFRKQGGSLEEHSIEGAGKVTP